jgi:energy-coupling factor transport system permease protein
LNVIGLLQYDNKNTFLHRLHPFTKITYVTMIMLLSAIFAGDCSLYGYLLQFGMMLITLSLWLSTKPSRERLFAVVTFMSWASVALIVMYAIFGTGKPDIILIPSNIPLLGGWGIRTAKAITDFPHILLPAFNLMFTAIIVTSTSNPAHIVYALSERGLPAPVCFIAVTALRFFPLVGGQTMNAINAMKVRGVEPKTIRPGRLIRIVECIFKQVLLNSLRVATQLSTSLDSRGFDPSRGLPTTGEVKFRVVDKVLIVLITLIFITFVVIKILVEIFGVNVVYPYW